MRTAPPPHLIQLNKRQPPVTIADLGLMLEIDLLLGRREDFMKRLTAALKAVTRH